MCRVTRTSGNTWDRTPSDWNVPGR
jgi:hypothetical protein